MLTVGEFSKICQVTVKTLHYYDRIGLLQPAQVDRSSGYRYYDRRQIAKMLLIQRLKRYGFTLEEIAELLERRQPDLLFSRLHRQRHKLEQQLQDTQTIIKELAAHLHSLERTGNLMNYQKNYKIEIVEAPAAAVLACRQNMSVDQFGQYYGTLYERVAKEKLSCSGVCGAIYHDREFDPENSDIELFVGVTDRTKADKLIPGTLCAHTVHKGAYSTLHEAYGALVEYLAASDYASCGAPYEIYAKGSFEGLPPDRWETLIYFPVRHK